MLTEIFFLTLKCTMIKTGGLGRACFVTLEAAAPSPLPCSHWTLISVGENKTSLLCWLASGSMNMLPADRYLFLIKAYASTTAVVYSQLALHLVLMASRASNRQEWIIVILRPKGVFIFPSSHAVLEGRSGEYEACCHVLRLCFCVFCVYVLWRRYEKM